ncbi:hypothetical protein [Methanococcoides methylutens]|uniref:hypothetical protein n=1 Tax=Methanococcoides methylutens TaxID=2226 RepID=UPI0013642A75|nr:hypothetical protein [Methanococcoides methylutens]
MPEDIEERVMVDEPEDDDEYIFTPVLYGGGKVRYIKENRKEHKEKLQKSIKEIYEEHK